jgi:hypothetical protein
MFLNHYKKRYLEQYSKYNLPWISFFERNEIK